MTDVFEVNVKLVIEYIPGASISDVEDIICNMVRKNDSLCIASVEVLNISAVRTATDAECDALLENMVEEDGIVTYDGDESKLTSCRVCGCYVYPPYGADAPAVHGGNAGTIDDPRAPGEQNNICDECCYSEDKSP